MKKTIIYISLFFGLIACTDKKDLLVPIPNDITFNELALGTYTHHVAAAGGFTSGGITFNTSLNPDGTFSGFTYSNQNNRSFVWTDSKPARDTNLFSVWTAYRNLTEVFVVACANDEAQTYFTLNEPGIVEHILIANTTYNYLAMTYGENSGSVIANPNIPSAPKGLWNTFAPGVKRKLSSDGDYYRIVITGYRNGKATGSIRAYLLCRPGADPEFPKYNFVRADWVKQDLSALGEVDKVSFRTECNYKDNSGKDLIHSWFCIDGIRMKN